MKLRRVRRALLSAMVAIVFPFGKMSTESDQAQFVHQRPEAPDVMWGTDMAATVTVAEGPAFVFVAVDHCTVECIGQCRPNVAS